MAWKEINRLGIIIDDISAAKKIVTPYQNRRERPHMHNAIKLTISTENLTSRRSILRTGVGISV